MKAGTIIARNYLAQASVLAESFHQYNPEFLFHILIIDGEESDRNCLGPTAQIVLLDDLPMEPDEWHTMAAMYDIMEFSTSIKPKFLEFLLADHTSAAIYLDPDIQIFFSLQELAGELQSESILLTPHCLLPISRSSRETIEKSIRQSGIFNLGFIGVPQSRRDFLAWWHERMQDDAVVDLANALFTDQRWIDFVPSLFPFTVLDDPGFNVAYWNLHERSLEQKNNCISVNGSPLKFFHFSGLDTSMPWQLTKYQEIDIHSDLFTHPVLQILVNSYINELQSHQHETQKKIPYGLAETTAGIPLNRYIRSAYRNAVKSYLAGEGPLPPSPFSEQSSAFTSWLYDAKNGIPGYQFTNSEYELWKSRPDIQQHFPDVFTGHSSSYTDWLAEDPDIQKFFGSRGALNQSTSNITSPLPGGWNVVGYFTAELGVGEAGRRLSDVVRCTGTPVQNVGVRTPYSREQHPNRRNLSSATKFENSILAVNADQTSHAIVSSGLSQHPRRRRIGFWFWELSIFPETCMPAFSHVSEVWCASEFTHDAVAQVSPVPVHHIRLPITIPVTSTPYSKKQAGLPEGFVFLFMFDFNSVVKRKNPVDVLTSYIAAFGPCDGAYLVIKSINGHTQKGELAKLRYLARDRPDVIVQDGYLSAGLVQAQIELCDCFVSLHRAEGYGLNIAAAMAAGKPTIATAYSGNMTFTSTQYPYLVPYDLIPVGTDSYPYDPKAIWGQPRLDVASSHMRTIFDDYSTARDHADVEKKLLLAHHSLDSAIESIRPLIID